MTEAQLNKLANQFAHEIEAKIQADIHAREKRHDYATIAKHYFQLALRGG